MEGEAESEAERTSEASKHPVAPRASDDAAGVSALLRPFAIFAVGGVLFGRAVAPSIAGSGVGLGRVIDTVERTGGIVSQSFVILGAVVLLGLVVAIARTRTSSAVRTAALALGGLVTLLVLSAAPSRGPDATLATIGVASSGLALVVAWTHRRAPLARAAAGTLGGVALSSLARLAAIALVMAQHERPGALALGAARALVVVSVLLDAAAVAFAAATLAPSRRSSRMVSPLLLVTLVLGVYLARLVLAGPDDASVSLVLLRRSVVRLMTPPAAPHLDAVRAFLAAFAPLVAVATLAGRKLVPAVSAALALALLVRSTPETPLCGLVLSIAALALALGASDRRGFWATLEARRAPNER